jgi:hypothetical protein
LEALEERAVPASLSYSTYFPGAVFATAVDSAGNVYATGAGGFVAKLNATGTALDYATYLPPTGGEGVGIAVDGAGDAYVIGASRGTGYVPTTANAVASTGRVFVAELDPSGGLTYATYLPGAVTYVATSGYAGAIAVDGSGDIDVTGAAQAGFSVTAGALQASYQGGTYTSNAFFAKINPALSGPASLVYATYLGGSGADAGTGIALDSAGNAYLTGYTSSSNFPTTGGAFQRAYGGGGFDAFVAKINPALSGPASLAYATYLGGSGSDGYVSNNSSVADNTQMDGGIAVDGAGHAYVTSATTSTNFPTTAGAFQVTSGLKSSPKAPTPSDAFVTELNATGTGLVYSTYLGGGTTRSGGAGIALDSGGDAHVAGWTNSTTFPTLNALQAANGGGNDAFVTVLNPSGSGLLFSSYFGGSGADEGYGIALDSGGNAYVGGQTTSKNFPTAGAYQTNPGSGFVLMIDPPAGGAAGSPATGGSGLAAPAESTSLAPPSAAIAWTLLPSPTSVFQPAAPAAGLDSLAPTVSGFASAVLGLTPKQPGNPIGSASGDDVPRDGLDQLFIDFGQGVCAGSPVNDRAPLYLP